MNDREALARVMDTLAYYHCRSVNPKADHPRMGYHAMTEDQREHLRERQREAAEEIVRMIPSLSRAAVPDAATEQPDGELAACLELRAYWRSKAIEARAERDAALEARQPREDDREAASVHEITVATVAFAKSLVGEGADHEDHDYYRKHVGVALDAVARAAAPDAATEELERWKGDYFIQKRAADKAEAERDAALAAVERVKVIHYPVPAADVLPDKQLCANEACEGFYPCDTRAALDGAPEPEEIAEQDAPVAAIEQDECTLPGHAGCTQVKVDGELWIDHFPSERGADTEGEKP